MKCKLCNFSLPEEGIGLPHCINPKINSFGNRDHAYVANSSLEFESFGYVSLNNLYHYGLTYSKIGLYTEVFMIENPDIFNHNSEGIRSLRFNKIIDFKSYDRESILNIVNKYLKYILLK